MNQPTGYRVFCGGCFREDGYGYLTVEVRDKAIPKVTRPFLSVRVILRGRQPR